MAVSWLFLMILGIVFFAMVLLPELYLWKIIIAFLLFVPATAQGLISGTSYSAPGVLNLSMVGYISFLASFILFARYKKIARKEVGVLFVCSLFIILIRMLVDGAEFLSNKLLDNYLMPMLLAVIMISYLKSEYIPELIKFIYRCILIGAVIACIEYAYGKSLLFHEYYMDNCPWYLTIYRSTLYFTFRSTSIFGHPLTGALYYLLAVVILLNKQGKGRDKYFRIAELVLLILALLTTNSRSALLGLAVYLVFYLVKNKKYGKLIALAASVFCLMAFVDLLEIYTILFERDSSGASFMVRVRALQMLADIPFKSLVVGVGYNDTSPLLNQIGFVGNFEISYLIILIENGILGFCAWVTSILFLYKNNMMQGYLCGIKLKAAVRGTLLSIFIVGGMSNSFGDPGTLNYTIYILLAFSSILAKNALSIPSAHEQKGSKI